MNFLNFSMPGCQGLAQETPNRGPGKPVVGEVFDTNFLDDWLAGCQGLAQEGPGLGPGRVVVEQSENKAALRLYVRSRFPPCFKNKPKSCRRLLITAVKPKQCHKMAPCRPGFACPPRPLSFRQASAQGWPVSAG